MLSKPFDCSLLAYGRVGLRPGWNGKMGLAINVANETAVKAEQDWTSREGNQLQQVRSDAGFEPLLDVAEAARLLRMLLDILFGRKAFTPFFFVRFFISFGQKVRPFFAHQLAFSLF
jgi:hypothetical protein